MVYKAKTLTLFLILLVLGLKSQNIPELQKFNNNNLFNIRDTTCFNVTGEWVGEEIQYDPTQSYIKVKFKVVFKLQQEGNRVFGTSFIQDKYRGSYGDMKIRGMISGNKLFFEEFEIMNEKFFQLGVVWCLRSGEMNIKFNENTATLEGLQYNGYASDSYLKCTDYVKMSVSKPLDEKNTPGNANSKKEKTKTVKDKALETIDVLIFPNPFIDESMISYELKKNETVKIDIYSLSGALIKNVINEELSEGKQTTKFNLSDCALGVYLVRLQAGDLYCTKQIVKMK